MCHLRHLCFILSLILYTRAAYDYCNDDNLNPVLRDKLRGVLKEKKGKYNCKLEARAAYEISLYNLEYPGNPEDVKKILKFMNEMTVAYKAKYFKSREELYRQMKRVKGRSVGCVHLLHQSKMIHTDETDDTYRSLVNFLKKYHRYICLIEKPSHWWSLWD